MVDIVMQPILLSHLYMACSQLVCSGARAAELFQRVFNKYKRSETLIDDSIA